MSKFLRLCDLSLSSNGGGEILESGGREGIFNWTTLSSASTQLRQGERERESVHSEFDDTGRCRE